jgi:hypothetical protein
MTFSSDDLDHAIDALDQLPESQVAALREMVAVVRASARTNITTNGAPELTSTWDPICAAMFFVVLTTTEASLMLSVR